MSRLISDEWLFDLIADVRVDPEAKRTLLRGVAAGVDDGQERREQAYREQDLRWQAHLAEIDLLMADFCLVPAA